MSKNTNPVRNFCHPDYRKRDEHVRKKIYFGGLQVITESKKMEFSIRSYENY